MTAYLLLHLVLWAVAILGQWKARRQPYMRAAAAFSTIMLCWSVYLLLAR